jgi:hypothetical protein
MRRRAGPEAPPGNRRRQFLSENRNSRYGESSARSAAYRRTARPAAEAAQSFGENAIPGRLTDKPLIFLETAKEKVWKSLEKLGISLEFPWKSLEILGKAWRGGDGTLNPSMGRRPLASEARAARRGGGFIVGGEVRG